MNIQSLFFLTSHPPFDKTLSSDLPVYVTWQRWAGWMGGERKPHNDRGTRNLLAQRRDGGNRERAIPHYKRRGARNGGPMAIREGRKKVTRHSGGGAGGKKRRPHQQYGRGIDETPPTRRWDWGRLDKVSPIMHNEAARGAGMEYNGPTQLIRERGRKISSGVKAGRKKSCTAKKGRRYPYAALIRLQ
jgi:hypothetical protein